jgi:hypothetical protein
VINKETKGRESRIQPESLGEKDRFESRARRMLSDHAPDMETYGFVYPSLLEDFPKEFMGLDLHDFKVLKTAGIEYADDFTIMSPFDLCLATEIEPDKIIALYFWAREAVIHTHLEEKDLIGELMAMCSARM